MIFDQIKPTMSRDMAPNGVSWILHKMTRRIEFQVTQAVEDIVFREILKESRDAIRDSVASLVCVSVEDKVCGRVKDAVPDIVRDNI